MNVFAKQYYYTIEQQEKKKNRGIIFRSLLKSKNLHGVKNHRAYEENNDANGAPNETVPWPRLAD